MSTATTNTAQSAAVAQSPRLIAVFALLAGLAIVYVTGFANATTLHNAAHDTRHTMAFPCH
ncbi:MAG: CbtB-domain containing protein [Kiloniellales bacterium]|nr:CbtB-domain containing protein [Kiloniellales bacterium]